MSGFGAGLAHALTAGLVGADQGRQDNLRAVLALKAQQEAKARQAMMDQIAQEDRAHKYEQDRIGNVVKGYQAGSTHIELDPGAPPAPKVRSFGDALQGGLGPFAPASTAEAGAVEPAPSLTTPVALGSIPNMRVTSTPESFNDPELARKEAADKLIAAREAANADRQDARLDKTLSAQDRRTAQMIAAQDARQAATNARLQSQGNPRQMQQVQSLQGHFNTDKTFKDAQEVATAYQKIKSAATGPHTATSDQALIYGIMKMQDPGSTVREGEYASAKNTAGVPDQIINAYNNALRGTLLGETQRQQFLQTAEQIARAQRSVFSGTLKRYSEIAKRRGVDPADVVFDPYEGVVESGPPSPPTQRPGLRPDAAAILKKYGVQP